MFGGFCSLVVEPRGHVLSYEPLVGTTSGLYRPPLVQGQFELCGKEFTI